MAILGVALCLFTALAHTLFRAPEAVVWIPWTFIFPAVIVAPRLLYRHSLWLRDRVTREWVKQMEQAQLMAVLLNMPGVLFFHVKYPQFQYDRFLHLAGAIVGVWWLALVLAPFGFSASRRRLLAVLAIAACAIVFLWEDWQQVQDRLVGSHTYFDYAQPIAVDYQEDVAFGLVGIVAGLLNLKHKFSQYRTFRT